MYCSEMNADEISCVRSDRNCILPSRNILQGAETQPAVIKQRIKETNRIFKSATRNLRGVAFAF